MRKIQVGKILIFLSLAFNSIAPAQIVDNIENFFYTAGYKKGYKDGYKKGYIEGYKQAVKDFKTVLKAYKDDIKALELGKYLFKEGYITFPRVYRIIGDNNEVKYKIVGCRIEKARNLEDIIRNPFTVPTISLEKIEKVKEASNRLITIPNQPLPKTEVEEKRVYLINLPKDYSNLLNRLGIPYELDAEKETIKAIFFSKKQLENFCKKYKCNVNK